MDEDARLLKDKALKANYLLPYAITFVNGEQGHIISQETGNFNFIGVQRLSSKRAFLVNTCGCSPYRIHESHRTYCLLPHYHPVHKVGFKDQSCVKE